MAWCRAALALLLAGMPSAAVTESEAITPLRAKSPAYWSSLARMYAARSDERGVVRADLKRAADPRTKAGELGRE